MSRHHHHQSSHSAGRSSSSSSSSNGINGRISTESRSSSLNPNSPSGVPIITNNGSNGGLRLIQPYQPLNWISELTGQHHSSGGNHRQTTGERMTLEQGICEDLHAFESRFEDIITSLRPSAKRWQILLLFSFLFTLYGAYYWLTDPVTYEVCALESFWNHKFFTANCILLLGLFFPLGIHRRICSPSIIRSRIQEVIAQFNMSCDTQGRLILMPHPSYYNQQNGGH